MSTVLFNTLDLALLFTLYQCLLFALFLVTLKKGNKQSNVLLALFLCAYAAIALDTLINFGEAFRAFAISYSPNVFYIFGSAYWIEAVLLLFYVRSLIYKDFTFKKADLLYLLPLFCYLVYEADNWYLLDSHTKLALLNGYELSAEPAYKRFINLFRESFRTFCGVLCLLELQRYQRQIKNEYADIEAVDLTWLKILVLGFLVIRIQAVLVTLGVISSIELSINIDYALLGQIANFMVMFLISFLIFFSISLSNLFCGIENRQEIPPENPAKQRIDPGHISALTAYMHEHKPYLNRLLTLDNLAGQLDISPRQLSQIINRHFKQNFFEFINGYRIDESKALLECESHRKTTMLEIMAQAGFNSKATFNTFFKKLVGLTPTQYRQQQLNS